MHIGPHLLTFIFSFLTLSVFWVNHHHFFHELDHADWKLLWYNNMLLFWLALVPLTTRFLASAITVPAAVGIYSFVLFMAAGSFTLLSRHAIFVGDLLDRHITEAQKKKYYRRSCFGVVLYGIATLVSPILYPLSFFLILFIPVYFTAPRLMHDHSMHLGE